MSQPAHPWVNTALAVIQSSPKSVTTQGVHLACCLDKAESSRQRNCNRERVIHADLDVWENGILLLLKTVFSKARRLAVFQKQFGVRGEGNQEQVLAADWLGQR